MRHVRAVAFWFSVLALATLSVVFLLKSLPV